MPMMVTTGRMVDAMRAVLRAGDLTAEERDLLERYGPTAAAYPMEIVELLRRKLPNKPYLHEFLAASSVAPPEGLPPKKKDPAYQARMDAIRAQLEEREYDRMTMDVRRQELTENERGEMTSVANSIGEGLNILVAKGTAFAVGYFASMAGGVDPVWNTICGLLGLIIGFLVESSLFVVRSSTVERENQKKKEAAERKFLAKGRMYRQGLEAQASPGGLSGTIGWKQGMSKAGAGDDNAGGVELQPLMSAEAGAGVDMREGATSP